MYGLMGPFATAIPIAGSVARAALRGYWQRPTEWATREKTSVRE